MQGSSSAERLTWDDLPAILLAGVSAITVTAGARLLRGQNPLLMLVLGVGVAGATFVLDRLLVQRLNSIRPRQSLPALLACWFPMFLFATTLATFATFSWLAPAVVRRDLDESHRQHWNVETSKLSAYFVSLATALRKQADVVQSDIDGERRRGAVARREGTVWTPDALRAQQRRLAALKELDKKLPTVARPPIDPPGDDAAAAQQLETGFRGLQDVHATAALLLPAPPPLPAYEPFSPPSADLQSVMMEETRKRTWRAISAWSAAAWVELLPLLALWRGGRKAALAARVVQWRARVKDTADAFRGRHVTTALPIAIQPLNIRGIVRVAAPPDYTLNDCTPLLEQAVETLTGVLGAYDLRSVSTARGERVNDGAPLLPQLNGQPLVLSVEESRA